MILPLISSSFTHTPFSCLIHSFIHFCSLFILYLLLLYPFSAYTPPSLPHHPPPPPTALHPPLLQLYTPLPTALHPPSLLLYTPPSYCSTPPPYCPTPPPSACITQTPPSAHRPPSACIAPPLLIYPPPLLASPPSHRFLPRPYLPGGSRSGHGFCMGRGRFLTVRIQIEIFFLPQIFAHEKPTKQEPVGIQERRNVRRQCRDRIPVG